MVVMTTHFMLSLHLNSSFIQLGTYSIFFGNYSHCNNIIVLTKLVCWDLGILPYHWTCVHTEHKVNLRGRLITYKVNCKDTHGHKYALSGSTKAKHFVGQIKQSRCENVGYHKWGISNYLEEKTKANGKSITQKVVNIHQSLQSDVLPLKLDLHYSL